MLDISVLPEYPLFTPLQRAHRELLEAALRTAQPQISEMSFAYQWIWRPYTHCRISRLRGAIVLMAGSASSSQPYLLPPVVAGPGDMAELIVSALTTSGPAGAFERVPRPAAELLRDRPGVALAEQRDRADYVHPGDELRELPGLRFHRKRNHIRQFRAACPNAEYREMTPALADRCAEFCREWLANHPKRDVPSLQREVDTTLAMLAEWDWLGLKGGVLTAEDQVVAFALGESINRETFAVRVEKADVSVPGAYQAINQEFARHVAAGFRWINREQDLGVPGLRRAKLSYYPHHLLRKYRISLQQ